MSQLQHSQRLLSGKELIMDFGIAYDVFRELGMLFLYIAAFVAHFFLPKKPFCMSNQFEKPRNLIATDVYEQLAISRNLVNKEA